MKIISLANQKGGVAKTTSTYNLAASKALKNNRVLMIDLDPRASLTISCGFAPGTLDFSTCHLFDGKTDPLDCGYRVKTIENLYIVPSDIELAEVEQAITGKTAREKLLRKAVKPFEDYFDYVFIDCPPQLGILTTNALVASTNVIIPSKAEYLSYRGIRALKRTIKNVVEEDLNNSLTLDGFIITMFEKNINDQKDMLEQFKKEDAVLGIIKKSADTYRNILDGVPVVVSNPKSDVAVAYTEIAEKL